MSLIAFNDKDAIQVGKPMPFSVYGSDRKLLLARGLPVTSERMREVVLAQAVYVTSPDLDTGAAELPPGPITSAPKTTPTEASTPPTPPMPTTTASNATAASKITGSLADLCRAYANYEERSRFGMRIARDERGESHPTNVIGVVNEKRYLILSAPVNKENVLIPMAKDEMWLCRLFNASTVFRFIGRVLKVAYEPLPYVHIELPKAIERRMVRRRPRALSNLAATLNKPDGDPCVVVDISVSGVRLALPAETQLQKNSAATLFVSIPMLERIYQLQVDIKITAAFGAGDPKYPNIHFYGAQFEELDDTAVLIVHCYVQAQLAEELDRLSRVLAIEAAYEASTDAWLNKR